MNHKPSELQHNVSLLDKNTLHLNSVAKNFFVISSKDDCMVLHNIYKELSSDGNTVHTVTIGEGSNIILAQKETESLIVKTENKGVHIKKENDDHIWIECSAGELFRDFVLWCCTNNYSGLENLAAIYGTVGASPVQNIGAYGQEVKNFIDKVSVFDIKTGLFRDYSNKECCFGYRNSIFKYQDGNKIIISVTFRLNKTFHFNNSYRVVADALNEVPFDEITPMLVARTVTDIRNSKLPDPNKLPNVGSFFKNPVISMEHYQRIAAVYPDIVSFDDKQGKKISAGWLIEQCGFKGKRIKNTGMHGKQALILVNYGNDNAEELLEFAQTVIRAVKTKFDINLMMEPHIIK